MIAAFWTSMVEWGTERLLDLGFAKVRRPRMAVVIEAGTYTILDLKPARPRQLAEGPVEDLAKEGVLRAGARRPVEVRIDGKQAVECVIQLPKSGRAYAGSIVRHQIDRVTPWTADSSAYDYNPVAGARDQVRLVAVGRAYLTSIVEAIETAGARVALAGISSDPIAAPSPIDLLQRRQAERQRTGRRIAAVGFASLLAIAAASVAGTSWLHWQAVRGSERAAANLDMARQDLQAARARSLDEATPRLIASKVASKPMVVLLDELSAGLPDETYLVAVSVEGAKVRMVGYSRNAPDLIRALEATTFLKGVAFASSVAHDAATRRDRFEIAAEIEQEERP